MTDLTPGSSVSLIGENGAEWVQNVPAPGSQLDALVSLVDTGRIVVVSGADDSELPEPTDYEWDDEVPTGTMDEIVAWVRQAPEDEIASDGWPERARAALDAELSKGDKARSTLIDTLTEALER